MNTEIYVGKFCLGVWQNGSIYITRISGNREGEGMEVPEKKFEEMLDKFYKENF